MPRVEIPLIGPNYTNRQRPLSAQKAINMWPEINPEARNQVCLHNTAGTRTFATLEGIDRGMTDFNNLMYAVNGQTLYSIDADGVNNALGTISGKGRCVMANDSTQLIITTGETPYRYTYDGGVEAITDPDLVNPTSVAYLNNQFIFDNNNGTWGEFVTSSIEEGLAIDSLDFANAESHPDDIVRVMAFRQLVYFFGSHSVEPWQNSGGGNPPFARLNSGVQPYGLAGTHGVVATDEYMYFLDTKRVPRRSNGLNFVAIGNPALGVEFAKYSKIDDVIAYEFTQDNQQFVVFTFPTANRSWAFHEPSGSWFQLTHGVGDDRHRASSMLNIYGLNYCADHTNGKIYEYSLDIFSDDGEPIIKQRDTAVIHGGLFGVPGKRLYFDEVEFIIVGGETEVAGTGLGAQPIVDSRGLCGTSSDLTPGQLLNISPLSMVYLSGSTISQDNPLTAGVSLENSTVISFTAAFVRENAPDAGFICHIIDFYNTSNGSSNFAFYMDSNGHMKITGLNTAATEILNVTITNNGGSFADSSPHVFGVVIDLTDEARREIYVDATNVGESTWVTWNTYTNDTLALASLDTAPIDLTYVFGAGGASAAPWTAISSDYNGAGPAVGIDTLGYISFDDDCSLIPSAIWDEQGYVRDPQAWAGWYMVQPWAFYGPSFWKNSGWSAPTTYEENAMEIGFEVNAAVDYYVDDTNQARAMTENTIINKGIGGTIEAIGGTDSLPSAPSPDPQTEIVAPFWENAGNWIDLSNLTQTTFEGLFGTVVEGTDFNAVYAVDKAALVNTSDDGNRLQIQDTIDCDNAYLAVTDASGNVVDSMVYAGVPNGNSVQIPTGANYYVVITSDTGNARIKKWDVTSTPISTEGSVSWDSFFGQPFGLNIFFGNVTKIIPAEGISIRFTIPTTSGSYKLSLSSLETPSNPGLREGAVNQEVLNFTDGATYTWGLGGGIDGGINLSGQDIDLIPGQTYFFNVRCVNPLSSGNYITLQASTLAA